MAPIPLRPQVYGETGPPSAALTKTDAARTKVLARTASLAGCVAHPGNVHIREYENDLPL